MAGLADLAVLQILVVAVGDPSLPTLFALKLVALSVAALVRVVGHRRILLRTVRADQAEPVARPPAPGDRRLTVVLPSYRQPGVVGEAVTRVRDLLVAAIGADELEVVVVDDGSGTTPRLGPRRPGPTGSWSTPRTGGRARPCVRVPRWPGV